MDETTDENRVNESNPELQNNNIQFAAEDVETLRQAAAWGNRVANIIAKEFYDRQFAIPERVAIFESYGQKSGHSLSQLRQHFEEAQVGYFRQIFKEAVGNARSGEEFIKDRFTDNQLYKNLDLTLKWYLGSYTNYTDLVRSIMRRAYLFRPALRKKIERALFYVFKYDQETFVEAFLNGLVESLEFDTDDQETPTTREEETADNYGAMHGSPNGVLVKPA